MYLFECFQYHFFWAKPNYTKAQVCFLTTYVHGKLTLDATLAWSQAYDVPSSPACMMICISFQSQSTVFRLASLFPPLSPSPRMSPIRQQTTPCFWPSHHLLLMDAGSHATDGLSTIKKRKKEKREGRQKNWRAKRDSKKRTQRRICFQPVFNLKDKKNLFSTSKTLSKT